MDTLINRTLLASIKSNYMDVRFCLRAVCMFEALRDKSYQDIDLGTAEDATALLYAMHLCSGAEPVSLEVFEMALSSSERIRIDLITQVREQMSVDASMASGQWAVGSDQSTPTTDDQAPTTRIAPIVARLISEGGLEPRYVMYEMGLWELPLHLRALEERRSEQMERERTWVYFLLSPHIDHTKIKSPVDLFPLPHERAKMDEEERTQDELYKLLIGQG